MLTFINIPIESLRRSRDFVPMEKPTSLERDPEPKILPIDQAAGKRSLRVKWGASSEQAVIFQSALPKDGVALNKMSLTLGFHMKGAATLKTHFCLEDDPVDETKSIIGLGAWNDYEVVLNNASGVQQKRTITVEIIPPSDHPGIEIAGIWLEHKYVAPVGGKKKPKSAE